MIQHIEITTWQTRQRNIWNAVLALITGILAFIWPDFLYYILAGYLVALAVTFFLLRLSSLITGFTLLMALLIILFPKLIPFSFGLFLAVLGLFLLVTFRFVLAGIVALVFAALIMANPDSIAWMIATFLLLYGLTHLIDLIQERRGRRNIPVR